MHSSAARQRKTRGKNDDAAADTASLPREIRRGAPAAASFRARARGWRTARSARGQSASSVHRRRRRFSAAAQFLLAVASLVLCLLLLLVLIDEALVRCSLSSYPDYAKLAAVTSSAHEKDGTTPSLRTATIAMVSLHEGFKYHGSLGRFLRDNKRSYASLHGYAYVDVFPNDGEEEDANKVMLASLKPWMLEGSRASYYKKPRMLLFLMEKYANLEWLLWADGDSIVTQPYVSIEDKIQQFTMLHAKEGSTNSPLTLVWAKDSTMANAGVLLIRNNPIGREYLRSALNTWEENDVFRTFTDQASLIGAGKNNSTYMDGTLLLQYGNGDSTLLQSRVRGPGSGLWIPGNWILHLPNHNYLELLSSLKSIGVRLEESPPPLFSPLERPSTDSLPKARRDRFEAVQEAIRHSWRGYADACLYDDSHNTAFKKGILGSHIPCDDLSPLASRGSRGHDWLYHAATLHDSLDTLALAFGTDAVEYGEAIDAILRRDLQATALRPTKTFEYSLRVVGGLLGAFSVTGDVRLLSRARDAADSLLYSPFASSPTVLPRMYDVLYPPRGGAVGTLYKVYSRVYQWGRDMFTSEHHFNSLAGVGSFSLEFYLLSDALGTPVYRQAADDIYQHVAKHQENDGTVRKSFNVMTGKPTTTSGGLGSGSDSFVEYLLKVPLFACGREANSVVDGTSSATCNLDYPFAMDMMAHYHKIMSGSLESKHIVKKEGDASIAYPADGSVYHQLLCFLPGLVALGEHNKAPAGGESRYDIAESMLRGCHDMYKQTPTGLGPEEVRVNQRSNLGDRRYLLRPEYVESLFVLYRLTGNEEYQQMGWDVFESLEHHCKTEWGYIGLHDVYDPTGGERIDDMPSYFIAETLKYLLLLFGPDDYLSLDEFVFTTEAHPLRRRVKHTTAANGYIREELARFDVSVLFPWPILGAFVVGVTSLGMIVMLIRKAVDYMT